MRHARSSNVVWLALAVTLIAGWGCNADRTKRSFDDGGFESPTLSTDGTWEPAGWPPSGGDRSHRSYVGNVGRFSFVLRPAHGDAPLITSIPDEGRGGAVAENLNQGLGADSRLLRIVDFDGAVYVATRVATYRCREHCAETERVAPAFKQLRETEDALYGLTRGDDGAIGRVSGTLMRRRVEAGGWSEVTSGLAAFNVCGDVLYGENTYGHKYSLDDGTTWQRPETNPRTSLYGDGVLVEYDGRYWAGSRVGDAVYTSEDCRRWTRRKEDADTVRYYDLTKFDGDLLAVETYDPPSEGWKTRIVRWQGDGWQPVVTPIGYGVLELHPVADQLRVMSDGAGLRRLDVQEGRLEAMGPPLGTPKHVAQGKTGMAVGFGSYERSSAALERADGTWRHFSFGESHSDRIWPLGTGFVFALGLDERSGFKLVRLTVDGNVETLVTDENPDTQAGDVQEVLTRDDELFVFSSTEGVLKVDESDGSVQRRMDLSGYDDASEPERFDDIALADGRIWVLSRVEDGVEVFRSGADWHWQEVSRGLPDGYPRSLESISAKQRLATTDRGVFLNLRSVHKADERRSRTFRWNPEADKWKPIPTPTEVQVDPSHGITTIFGASRRVYGVADERVLQYDPAQGRWFVISDGLPESVLDGSLLATDERLWVVVPGRGVWTYPARDGN